MTTTLIKDVGSMLAAGYVSGGATSKGVDESFQSVWDSQAGADRPDEGFEPEKNRTQKHKEDAVKPGDDLRAKDSSHKDIEEFKPVENDGKAEMISEEDFEKAAEIIGSAVADLLQQIADTFGISVEEVESIMADMDLQPVDLLTTENLSNLLLQVSGAEDTLSLLTNEQLYSDYQMHMDQGKALVEQCADMLDVTPKDLEVIVENLQVAAEEVPVEELPVEDAKPDSADADETADGMISKVAGTDKQVQTTENSMADASRAQDGEDTGRNGQNMDNANQTGNLVLETIRNEETQIFTDSVQAPAGTWSAETQDMMQQIMDYMRVQVKPDVSSLEMQLHPASLGTLQIQVTSEGGVLTANFITENETVKAAIESQMVQLKESFAEQGVKVEAIEVTVQTHQFEQNLEQGRGRQSQSEQSTVGRTRTRRINLNGLDDLEMAQELEEEDQLTAEMMAANGQTVDYTA